MLILEYYRYSRSIAAMTYLPEGYCCLPRKTEIPELSEIAPSKETRATLQKSRIPSVFAQQPLSRAPVTGFTLIRCAYPERAAARPLVGLPR